MYNKKVDLNYGLIKEAVSRQEKASEKKAVKSDRLVFADHQSKFVKVAWDLWKLKDAPEVNIWQLEDADEEGIQYISRAGDWSDSEETEETNKWDAVANASGSHITVSYRNVPISKVATAEYNIPQDEINTFRSSIIEYLKEDKEHVTQLLDTVSEEYRNAILDNFPELK